MSVDTLRRRVAALYDRAKPPPSSRDWVIDLEEGEELCEELRAQLGPYDTLCIRFYPRGYLGVDGTSTSGQFISSWRRGPRGRLIPHIVRQYGVDISKV